MTNARVEAGQDLGVDGGGSGGVAGTVRKPAVKHTETAFFSETFGMRESITADEEFDGRGGDKRKDRDFADEKMQGKKECAQSADRHNLNTVKVNNGERRVTG